MAAGPESYTVGPQCTYTPYSGTINHVNADRTLRAHIHGSTRYYACNKSARPRHTTKPAKRRPTIPLLIQAKQKLSGKTLPVCRTAKPGTMARHYSKICGKTTKNVYLRTMARHYTKICGKTTKTFYLPVEDHGSARAAKALVGGRGDDVGVAEGRGDDASRDEAADVRHVGQQPRAGRVGDLPHASVVDVAGVSARPGHNQLFSSAAATATTIGRDWSCCQQGVPATGGVQQQKNPQTSTMNGIYFCCQQPAKHNNSAGQREERFWVDTITHARTRTHENRSSGGMGGKSQSALSKHLSRNGATDSAYR